MEEGLVSDQKVKAQFPAMDGKASANGQPQKQSEVPRATEPVGQ